MATVSREMIRALVVAEGSTAQKTMALPTVPNGGIERGSCALHIALAQNRTGIVEGVRQKETEGVAQDVR